MKKVCYTCDNGYSCKSLSELRNHVEFVYLVFRSSEFDGVFFRRLIWSQGRWNPDHSSLRKIEYVDGKVVFRIIKSIKY